MYSLFEVLPNGDRVLLMSSVNREALDSFTKIEEVEYSIEHFDGFSTIILQEEEGI
jgi:hypothetical protein